MSFSKEERAYRKGNRSAWSAILRECLRNLDYSKPQDTNNVAKWIIEREATIHELRSLCEDFGDNDWDEDLNLADVVRRHLGNHLYETKHKSDK